MSTSPSPSPARAPRFTGGSQVPVAGPPKHVPRITAAPIAEELPPEPWWTPESLKGWAASFGLHALLLIVLACWYFVPETQRPRTFDTRLAGSKNGVPEGEELTGGLNTPLPMPDAPLAPDEVQVIPAPLNNLDLKPLQPEISARSHDAASGGGGAPSNNPGSGDGDGFGLARFGEGGELIQGVQVKVGDPQFTLIWDTNDVDLDLHVIEPGGKEIYWEDPKGNKGGELDVDNTKGYGPENVYWLVESNEPGGEKVKGPGPPGVYKWFVVYWGGFGGRPRPTHWQVRVKHAGKVNVFHGKFKALNEHSKVHTLTVEPPGAASVAP